MIFLRLQRACKKDLPKFCAKEIDVRDSEKDFLEGKVGKTNVFTQKNTTKILIFL